MRTLGEVVRWRARTTGDDPALSHAGRTLLYRELDAHTTQLANGLIARGVAPGDRVLALDKGHGGLVELLFAAAKAGAVFTPLNWRLSGAELVKIAQDSQARVLLAGADFSDVAAEMASQAPALAQLIRFEAVEGEAAFANLYQRGADPQRDTDPRATVLQVYTSGTTGAPKGVELSHDNVLAMCACSDNRYRARDGGQARMLACLPLFHVGGAGSLVAALFDGAHVFLKREARVGEILASLREERITHALLVPALIGLLLQEAEGGGLEFSHLETIVYGASPMPDDILRRAMALFRCGFVQAYGMTETTGTLTLLSARDHAEGGAKLQSCGKPVFGNDVRIAAPDGRACAPGEIGEIIVRGAHVMKGYWNRPDATADAIRNGWLHTGDAARVDAEGYIYIQDRIKDMIICGGENIYPAEVENVLHAMQGVADAAVIGAPDPVWGEIVLAVVAPAQADTLTEADVISHCRARIAPYKAPRRVLFVEALPRNPSGKVLKSALRAAYWAGRDRNVN